MPSDRVEEFGTENQLKKVSNRIGCILLFSYLISYGMMKLLSLDNLFFYASWGTCVLIANYGVLKHFSAEHKVGLHKNKPSFFNKILKLGIICLLSTHICVIIIFISKPLLVEGVSGSEAEFNEVLTGGIVAPIVEEIIFRGILLHSLGAYGRFFSLIITTVLFTLMHGGGFPLVILIVGFMCGVLMLETKNILYPIILHILHNLGILANPNRIVLGDNNYTVSLIIIYSILIIFLIRLGAENREMKTELVLLKNWLHNFTFRAVRKDIVTFFTTSGMLLLLIYFGLPMVLNIVGLVIKAIS